jgi:hypothetical protein
MTGITGGCLCGAIRYTLGTEPVMQAVCHCRNCQKQAGSAYSIIVGVPEAAISIEGTPTDYADQGETGNAVLRQFCGTCGSPLFSRAASVPGMILIKAGTLDDPSGFQPQVQVWAKSKQTWVDLGAVPSFETVPGA